MCVWLLRWTRRCCRGSVSSCRAATTEVGVEGRTQSEYISHSAGVQGFCTGSFVSYSSTAKFQYRNPPKYPAESFLHYKYPYSSIRTSIYTRGVFFPDIIFTFLLFFASYAISNTPFQIGKQGATSAKASSFLLARRWLCFACPKRR